MGIIKIKIAKEYCERTIEMLTDKRYFKGLSAKESAQLQRAKNLLEDFNDWDKLTSYDTVDTLERYFELCRLNKVLGI